MSTTNTMTRRSALGLIVLGSSLAAAGCAKKELACNDVTGLAPADAQMRTSQGYTDRSPEAAKQCANCQLYKPAAPEQCGGCTVLKGPVSPKGYCKLWVVKQG